MGTIFQGSRWTNLGPTPSRSHERLTLSPKPAKSSLVSVPSFTLFSGITSDQILNCQIIIGFIQDQPHICTLRDSKLDYKTCQTQLSMISAKFLLAVTLASEQHSLAFVPEPHSYDGGPLNLCLPPEGTML